MNSTTGRFTAISLPLKSWEKNIISGQFNFSADDLAFIATNAIHTDHDQTYTSSAGIKYTLPTTNTRFAVDLTAASGLRTTRPGGPPNGGALPGYQQVNFQHRPADRHRRFEGDGATV